MKNKTLRASAVINSVNPGLNHGDDFIIEEASQVFETKVIEIKKLAGDASERRFYRILLHGKPGSVILMKLARLYPDFKLPYIIVGRFFKEIGLPVPDIYHYNRKRGFLFLEDSGERSLFDEIEDKGFQLSYYRQALDLLLLLQGEGSRKCDKKRINIAFDEEKFLWELTFFVKHAIEGHRNLTVSKTDRKTFREEFRNLIRPLLARPTVLTHRDYHSRNLMTNGKKLTIIDFQDTRWGPCQYDVASLLRDSYVRLEDEQVSELIEYYLKKRRRLYGYNIDPALFRRLFDWMSVQRNLKAIGTFTSQLNLRQNDRYLRFIPTTAGYVRDNCKKYPELNRLGELLYTYKIIEA